MPYVAKLRRRKWPVRILRARSQEERRASTKKYKDVIAIYGYAQRKARKGKRTLMNVVLGGRAHDRRKKREPLQEFMRRVKHPRIWWAPQYWMLNGGTNRTVECYGRFFDRRRAHRTMNKYRDRGGKAYTILKRGQHPIMFGR